jgi:hypothetical protein
MSQHETPLRARFSFSRQKAQRKTGLNAEAARPNGAEALEPTSILARVARHFYGCRREVHRVRIDS